MRTRLLLALVIAVTPMFGCAIAGDVFNSDLLGVFGLDPATVIPDPGRVVIAYHNATTGVASFSSAVSDDTLDPTSNAKSIISSNLLAGETRAMVVDCPVGVITPGAPATDFSTGTTAAFVVTEAGELVEVAYNGFPLVSGNDFGCGDVIQVRVVESAGEYALQVSILAGS